MKKLYLSLFALTLTACTIAQNKTELTQLSRDISSKKSQHFSIDPKINCRVIKVYDHSIFEESLDNGKPNDYSYVNSEFESGFLQSIIVGNSRFDYDDTHKHKFGYVENFSSRDTTITWGDDILTIAIEAKMSNPKKGYKFRGVVLFTGENKGKKYDSFKVADMVCN